MIKVSIHSKLELLTCFSVKSKKLNKFGPIMSVCGGNSLFCFSVALKSVTLAKC